MYILLIDEIGNAIVESLRTLSLSIFESLLNGIATLYELFIKIADYRLFTDETIIQGLYTRIGLILGLFMVFRITFSAIEYLINPDTMLDKTKGLGNIVKKVLIMIILLGSVHFLFDKAYEIQHMLLKGSNNILAKIVLNKVSGGDGTEGRELEWVIFSSFYRVNEEVCPSNDKTDSCELIRNVLEENKYGATIYHSIVKNKSIGNAYTFINANKDGADFEWTVSFDWFYGILVAGVVLYVLIL